MPKYFFELGVKCSKYVFLQGSDFLTHYLLPSHFQSTSNFLIWLVGPLLISLSTSEGFDPITGLYR